MGYNEITKLNISKDESTKVETTSQEDIRQGTKEFFQKIYNKQSKMTPSKEEIGSLITYYMLRQVRVVLI